jgi:peptidoglycan-associated lipoprotein
MNKILSSLLIAFFVVGCASKRPAPISEPPRAQVEEKSIGGGTGATASGADGGTASATGADGMGPDGVRAEGADGAGGRGRDAQGRAVGPGAGGADAAGQGGAAADGGPSAVPGKSANELLAQRSIFYDFDSFTVREEYKPVIEAHARFLVEHPTARIFLQGSTDERGSREYNLALGQRRADSVRRVMAVLGVNENQIETVSFGEEKPRAPGHDEAAWAQNRRTDIVYQGE